MKATIKIEMLNSAFNDCNGNELARILKHLAEQVKDLRLNAMKINAYDINGNTVGTFRITK